jgi:phage tail sheath protein FI
MAEYLSPAVFIEELSSGIKPIQAVGTSTGAFVGHAERGPVGQAVAINNFGQFLRRFGGFYDGGYLAFAVKSFFDEGGSSCYVARAAHYAGAPPVSTAVPAAFEFNRVIRNGLGAASKTGAAAGFADIQIGSQQGDATFLISYVAASRTLTVTRGDGTAANVILAAGAIAAGQSEQAAFPTLNTNIVLDSNFNKGANIALDPNVVSVTGAGGAIDAATVQIFDSAGDISAINATLLTMGNLATPAAISVAAAGGFAGSFDGTTIGVKTVVLTNGANSLTIRFNVTTIFSGAETAATIDLQHLENLVVSTASSLRIEANSPGSWGNDFSVGIDHELGDLFRIRVVQNGSQVELITGLSMDPLNARYVVAAVQRESTNITAVDRVPPASTLTALERRPSATTAQPLTGGNDGLGSIGVTDYVGDESVGNGLHAFDPIDAINIVAVPEAVDRDVHIQGMAYCESRGDCFYVAEAPEAAATADEVLNYKLARGLYAGGNAFNSKYGALYTPWIRVLDPRTASRITIPSSAAVAGRYARTDGTRGVHKAPAGVTDGRVATALELAVDFSTADQEKLNPKGVNVIRKFSGVGNVVWGARTVSTDPEWRLLNVRRLFLFLEESIEESTSWAVFEPNDPTLWKALVRNVTAFLRLQWLAGALVGATEEQAFFVKCDEETNPPESVLLGRVITEIGVAPSKPAEFVIFRIAQFQGGSEVSE